jgi:CHAT domain-containing protein/Tfp pilus assembly protein PilF
MNIGRFILWGSFMFPMIISAQNVDTIGVSLLMNKAARFADSSIWDSSSILYEQAADQWGELIEKNETSLFWGRYFTCKNQQIYGLARQNRESDALRLIDQELPLLLDKLGQAHPKQGFMLYAKATALYSEFSPGDPGFLPNIEKAQTVLFEALEIVEAKLPKNHLLRGDILYNLGLCHNRLYDYEKAVTFFSDALPIFKEKRKTSYPLCLIEAGYSYLDMGNFEKALDLFGDALQANLDLYGPGHVEIGISYVNIGFVYAAQGIDQEALKQFLSALPILREQNHSYLGAILNNIGIIYFNQGAFTKALSYYQETLRYYQSFLPPNNPRYGGLLVNIGAVYSRMREFDKALEYYLEALPIVRSSNPRFLANCLMNIANSYRDTGNTDFALEYHQEALGVKETILSPNHPDVGVSLMNIGSIYRENIRDYDKALEYYFRALSIFEATGYTAKTLCLRNIGGAYFLQKNYSKALDYYQKAIAEEVIGFDNEDPMTLPPIQAVAKNNRSYLSALNSKGIALGEMAREKPELLYKADSCFKLAIHLTDRIRASYRNDDNKIDFLGVFRVVYIEAIKISLALYEKTGEKNYLNQALIISEKSKSSVLNEAVKSRQAMEFAGIPITVLTKVSELQDDLGKLEASVFQLENTKTDGDSSQLMVAKSDFFTKKQTYDSLLDVIEANYPRYYQLKYDVGVIGKDSIQAKLAEDEAFISYFNGDSILIAIVLTKQEVQYFTIKTGPDFTERILHFHQSLSETLSPQDQKFAEESYGLFQKLLLPVKHLIYGKKLIISPDGVLALIPFETLVSNQEMSKKTGYHSLAYLIKQHEISYAYSATLHADKKAGNAKNESILAFAPSFGGTALTPQNGDMDEDGESERGKLANLKGIYREMNLLKQYFPVKSYTDEEAKESRFKSLAADYGILHLATHAIMDAENPMESYLVFTADGDSMSDVEDNNLYAWELYNMKLNAQMAVLSACNTGFGKVQRGEGVMSLGRAFAYAGVPSIVMSLWPAPDEATADLMGYFYEGLAEGQAKDEALRNAKLRFLEEMPPRKHHPFYWAGFVVQGDAEPLERDSYRNLAMGIGVFIFLVGILLGVRYMRRRREG